MAIRADEAYILVAIRAHRTLITKIIRGVHKMRKKLKSADGAAVSTFGEVLQRKDVITAADNPPCKNLQVT